MPPSVNTAYGNGRYGGRFKTKKYYEWEKSLPPQQGGKFKYTGKVLMIDYVFYSKWYNKNGTVKKKDVSNYIKVVEDSISKYVDGFDDRYVWNFTAKKVHSDKEEVVIIIREIK